MKRLILASTSPRRKELLATTGIPFTIAASSYVENMTLDLPPTELALHLSKSKAKAVADTLHDAVVIGADTFIVYQNKILGKPHTPARAKETLTMLSGRQHSALTGFTIIDANTNKTVSKVIETKVFFKNLSEKDIDEYVATGDPLDKAGAYAIQGIGKILVDHIEGSYDSVVGLPVIEVLEELKAFGITK